MTASPETRSRKRKARKFYTVYYRVHSAPGLELENVTAALNGGRVLMSPRGERRFPPLSEPLRILIDRSLGRAPVDWELFHDFWLVSDRMKEVLETIDREGVAFLDCETRTLGRKLAPVYWLCDVVRVLDVIDEERSRLQILDDGTKYRRYDILKSPNFVFR